MGFNLTRNALEVEAVKGNDHFLLVYPNSPAGRLAAKEAVRVWLLDCELDFNRQDAERLWRAIDARRFGGRFDRRDRGGGVMERTRKGMRNCDLFCGLMLRKYLRHVAIPSGKVRLESSSARIVCFCFTFLDWRTEECDV